MNNTSTNHSVRELLKELRLQVKALKTDSSGTSQLELDLMKEKIRSIYDILNDVKIETQKEEQIVVESIPQAEPEIEKLKEEETIPEAVPELVLEIEEETEAGVEVFDKEEEPPPPPPSEPTLSLFEEPVENLEDKKIVGEKFAEEKQIEPIGETIQNKKIVNLKLAIGINEKFFFLNELFDGKMNEYNKTIEELDLKDTFKEAIEYLVLLKEENSWDEESEAYVQLKGFLERKFNESK